MKMAPYAYLLHKKVIKHLAYILNGMCDILFVGLMPHCLLIGKVYNPAVTQDNCPFSQIWTSTCSPYVQPLHMKVKNSTIESWQTPCIYPTSMCDILWGGLMPHCLLIGKVYNPAVTQGKCSFPKSMMMAPYVQPLHMKVGKHLEYILKAS